jgi:hypothetical protein
LTELLAKRFVLFREVDCGVGGDLGASGVAMGLRPNNPLPLNLSSLFVIGLRVGVGVEQSAELGSRYSWKKPGELVGVGVGMSKMVL